MLRNILWLSNAITGILCLSLAISFFLAPVEILNVNAVMWFLGLTGTLNLANFFANVYEGQS